MYKIYKNQERVTEGRTRFLFELRHRGRRHREKIICQKSAVKTFYSRWERQILDGSFEFRDYQFFEILDLYLENVKEKKTKLSFIDESRTVRLLKTFFPDMKLADFRRFHVDDYISWRRKNPLAENLETVTPATINKETACISCFFNFAIMRGFYNSVNPAYRAKLKVQDREIRLTAGQVSELLEKAEAQGRGIYTAVLIALLTGLRRKELFNLKWNDVDFNNSLIHLRAETCKGHKRRVVAVPDFLKAHLIEVKKENPFKENIFHDWQTFSKLRFEWNRLRETLSFKILSNGLQLHFHDLRHIYAQSLRDAGISLDDISGFLGHSSVTITQSRYAQFSGAGALAKVNKIGNIIPLRSIG